MALPAHVEDNPPPQRRAVPGSCADCRPSTFGVFLCDACRERARLLRTAELAAARVVVELFAGVFSVDREKERGPGFSTSRAPTTDHTSGPAADTETTTPIPARGSISTRWRPHNERARLEMFADPAGGYGVGPAGRFTFVAGRSIVGLLRALPDDVDRVYLTGPVPGDTPDGLRRWATSKRWPPGWAPAPEGHFVERPENPVLKYDRQLPEGRRRVEIHRAAPWFGDDDYSPEMALAARQRLAALIRSRFPQAGPLLATPATTGVELWRSLIPYGAEWPVLSDELRDLIRSTMGQGRFEFFPPAAGELGGLEVWDGRFMYGALCRELPVGEPRHDRSGTFHGYARARYRVTAAVPPGWAHPGILGHQGDGGWRYPRRAGRRFESWCDGAELLIAQRAGWRFDIHEAWVWPKADAGAGDPLRGWAERLIALRREALRADDGTGPMVARALRALLLFAVGRFGAGTRYLTRSASRDDPAAAGAALAAGAQRFRVEDDRIVWAEPHEPAPELAHPEWAAAIYGRARARLLHAPTGTRGVNAGALHVDPRQLLRLALDSLTLTGPPGWPDDGAEGRLRLKQTIPGPMVAPDTETALVAIQRAHEHATSRV